MSILLETRGLSKIYGKGENEVRALNKCDLTFAEGSFTSIVGRSGSGKSTLMHLLGGLDTPPPARFSSRGRILPICRTASGPSSAAGGWDSSFSFTI